MGKKLIDMKGKSATEEELVLLRDMWYKNTVDELVDILKEELGYSRTKKSLINIATKHKISSQTKRNKNTKMEVIEEFNLNGWLLDLSTFDSKFKTKRSKIDFICEDCEDVYSATYYEFKEKKDKVCLKCIGLKQAERYKFTYEEACEKVRKAHNGNIIVISDNYVKSQLLGTFKCQTHDVIWDAKWAHVIHGHGCKECGSKKKSESQKFTIDDVKFELAKLNSNLKLDTSICQEYETNKTELLWICKTCGEKLKRNWNNVKNGQDGCEVCSPSSGWSRSNWKLAGNRSKNFDGFKLYILKCKNKEEEFYKIGRTYTTINKRFRKNSTTSMPYEYSVLKEIVGSSDYIYDLENKLQKHHRRLSLSYAPKIEFGGMTECFSDIEWSLIEDTIDERREDNVQHK